MKETELAELVIAYLSDWDIYKEVPCAGIIDIIAVKKPVVIAVECKMTFGIDVIYQAEKNKRYAHYSYVAVPKESHSMAKRICGDYGIGILAMNRQYNSATMMEVLAPRINRRIKAPVLKEWMKESVAGSQSDRMTAFKNTVRNLLQAVQRNGGSMSVDVCLKTLDHHYGSLSSAKTCIMARIRDGVITGITYEKGIFKIISK